MILSHLITGFTRSRSTSDTIDRIYPSIRTTIRIAAVAAADFDTRDAAQDASYDHAAFHTALHTAKGDPQTAAWNSPR